MIPFYENIFSGFDESYLSIELPHFKYYVCLMTHSSIVTKEDKVFFHPLINVVKKRCLCLHQMTSPTLSKDSLIFLKLLRLDYKKESR